MRVKNLLSKIIKFHRSKIAWKNTISHAHNRFKQMTHLNIDYTYHIIYKAYQQVAEVNYTVIARYFAAESR